MLPEEEREQKRMNWLSVEILLPMIVLVFIVLFIGRLGTFDFDFAQMIFIGAAGMGWFSILVMDEFRHRTRKVVLPTGFTTFNGNFLVNKYSNYGIIKAGTLRAMNIEVDEINEGLIIFPLDMLKKTGRCAVLMADAVKKVKLNEIDDRLVISWIIKNSISEPYYLLRSYSSRELRKPDIRKLNDILDNTSEANKELDKKIKNKFTVTEDSVASGSRIRDIATELKRRMKELKPSE